MRIAPCQWLFPREVLHPERERAPEGRVHVAVDRVGEAGAGRDLARSFLHDSTLCTTEAVRVAIT